MNWSRFVQNRLVLALVVAILCIALDQGTKELARRRLEGAGRHSYLADTVRLEFALNSGGFLSMGGQLSPSVRQGVFIVFNSVAMLLLTGFLISRRDAPLTVFLAMVLIIAGGIGNLIDRITNDGMVTDFINMGIGPLRTGIFNVADIAVTYGVVIVFWWLMTAPDEQPRKAETDATRSP